MPLGKNGQPLKVTVSPHAAGYQITWIDPGTGRRRHATRHTEHEARRFQAEVVEKMKSGAFEKAKKVDIKVKGSPRDGSYWLDALGACSSALLSDPGNEELHKLSQSIAKLAASARSFVEVVDGEQKLKELEELVGKLRRGEKYGLANPFVQGAPPAH